jgi:biopolymer transport protein ExbB
MNDANPYGLDALWSQGDLVARATLMILAVMSVASWTILILKLVEQSALLRRAKAAEGGFWNAPSLRAAAETLAEDSPFRVIALSGIAAVDRHGESLLAKIDLHSWVSLSLQRSVGVILSRAQGGLSVLATVGSTAPFVGLFGTVWGIYHALTAIGIAGQASIDKVAGPVGEALIMTAIGLAVAVPAVLGYNLLTRRNKLVGEAVRGFASDLHSVLLVGLEEDHSAVRLKGVA